MHNGTRGFPSVVDDSNVWTFHRLNIMHFVLRLYVVATQNA